MDAEKHHLPQLSPSKSTTGSPTDFETSEIVTTHNVVNRPGLMTRLGLTGESFKRRTVDDKHNQLNQTLKSRHLNMIAIGGSIGAGLFVGSGSALSKGGPAALLIGFGIIGVVGISPEQPIHFY